jgi:arylsulfate sulfotransferase
MRVNGSEQTIQNLCGRRGILNVTGEPGWSPPLGGSSVLEAILRACVITLLILSQSGCGSSTSSTTSTVPTEVLPGTVSATNNPQVALYTIAPQGATSVAVEFGLASGTSYPFVTAAQTPPQDGSPVNIFVAGMLADTTYHMRALLTFSGGTVVDDSDHSFTTGDLPAQLPTIAVSQPSSLTPQSGVEILDSVGVQPQAIVTDLQGNVIWTYTYTGMPDIIQPIKLLPNGDFLLVISPNSSTVTSGPPPAGSIQVLREINLEGDTVRELSLATLNSELSTAGFDLVADDLHHDVLPLPNGHIIVLVNTTKDFTDLPGYTGTTTVIGDAMVDLDPNLQPVWVWNAFDYLDVNRHPMNFPDWTHSNALLYSPDDGNLLISMRHQNWILKIDYENGKGSGAVLWHLGEGGDFALQGGVDPTDWFYAQHGPSFIGSQTAGKFTLTLFDNGDDRMFPTGVTCGAAGAPPCLYSTVPILQIDETAKTASLTFNYPAPQYSFFGGNSEQLSNGDIEFDESAASGTALASAVFEITQGTSPQVVWQMNITGTYAYRAMRLPSLYPGVQW